MLQLALLGFDMPIRYQSKVPAKFSSICQVSRLIAKRPDMQTILAKKKCSSLAKCRGGKGTVELSNTIQSFVIEGVPTGFALRICAAIPNWRALSAGWVELLGNLCRCDAQLRFTAEKLPNYLSRRLIGIHAREARSFVKCLGRDRVHTGSL